MKKQFELWCYGGKNKAFFISHSKEIHQYNSKMMDRLLLIMTVIIGRYLLISTGQGIFSKYGSAYLGCFTALLFMLCTFKINVHKSFFFTKIYIVLFSAVLFVFVSILGTIFEPEARATLFIVYVLVLPMLFIVPTHYMYGFLILATGIFSIMALQIKTLNCAQMDIAHSLTCIVIGFFICHHILESRMTLYELNELLDTRNIKLESEIKEKKLEQEKMLRESRVSIMLTQIQPHFLYNTLTAICGLCDENQKEAKKMTAEFADYLRHNMECLTQSNPIPFENELQHTKIYLSIEKKRFEEKLNIVYDIAVSNFLIPVLIMQPLVENAVKHGVTKKKKGGTVTITTREQLEYYEIIISDDGVGFDTSVLKTVSDSHIGIDNVRYRLWSMCQQKLVITSEVGLGTSAVIKIPKGL